MASNIPRAQSSTNLNEETLRQMKLQYLYSVLNLERNDAKEDANIDIAEWAKIFQAMHFKLRHFDNDRPIYSDNASNKSGISVVITCHKTSQRVTLVKEDNACSCVIKAKDEAVWEVVATSNSMQSLIESGSTSYPPLATGSAALVNDFMNYVGGIATGRIIIPSTFTAATPNRRRSGPLLGSSGNVSHRLSIDSNTQGILNEFPSRYRSLDTLISQDADDGALPEPGPLLKPNVTDAYKSTFTKSEGNNSISPSLSKLASPMTNISPTNIVLLNYIKTAHEHLEKAMSMMSVNKTPAQKNEGRPSEKKLTVKPGYLKLSKSSPSMDNTAGTGALRRELKRPMMVLTKTLSSATKSAATPGSACLPKPSGLIRKKDKYAHVSSTIPKFK